MGGDGGVGRDVGGVAEEVAVGAIYQGVAAIEDAEGAEGFEARGGAVEARVGLLEGDGASGAEALGEGLEAVAVVGEAEGGILAAKAGFELGEALVLAVEGPVQEVSARSSRSSRCWARRSKVVSARRRMASALRLERR